MKPRLSRFQGSWNCESPEARGRGLSVALAYWAWWQAFIHAVGEERAAAWWYGSLFDIGDRASSARQVRPARTLWQWLAGTGWV